MSKQAQRAMLAFAPLEASPEARRRSSVATDSLAFAATTMQCTFRKRVAERQVRVRQAAEAAAFAAVNTDDGNIAVTRISRLFRARKQFARTMVKSHQTGLSHIYDDVGRIAAHRVAAPVA